MKTIQILLALSLMMGAQACETEIPETDVDPPTFSIKITGDGFDETFYQDTNFDRFQLNLREGAEYTFLISGGDTGGLKRFEVYFAPDYIQMNPNLWGKLGAHQLKWPYRYALLDRQCVITAYRHLTERNLYSRRRFGIIPHNFLLDRFWWQ